MSEARIEVVARALCTLRGIDPDKSVAHAAELDPVTGFTPAVVRYSPAWTLVAREVRARMQMDEALRTSD